MGLFFADDSSYDESVRLTGFDRYRQLLSFNAGIYFKVNFLTILGALPLAAGITYSVLSSSVLLLIPFSVIGGMLFGPFYAAFYNTLYRTFRDAPVQLQSAPQPRVIAGKKATFALSVRFRQHSSWQGYVTWLDKGQKQNFRSVLELIFLVDSALREQAPLQMETISLA